MYRLLQVLLVVPLLVVASFTTAKEVTVSIEIPSLNVAEYHRPYVAVWIEHSSGKSIPLSVWYQLEERGKKSEKGEEWLKDMRQWWRRIGRASEMPIDGVSGATRVVGKHQLTFVEGEAPLGKLVAGNYTLMVEAAREVGGRELVKMPFTVSDKESTEEHATGHKELGLITLSIN